MRAAWSVLLLALASNHAPPRAESAGSRSAPIRLSPDAEARWVAFTLTPGNQIQFDMTIDGQHATAILDTGVSRSVVSRRFAAAAHLAVAGGGQANAIGGPVTIDRAAVHRLTIGGLTRDGGDVSVVTLPANATNSDTPVDMLVGQDVIGRVAVDIDYPHARFRLIPAGRLPFRGLVAPLRLAPGLDLYVTTTRIGAVRQQPVMIDTGDGAAVTFSRGAWRAAHVAATATTTALAYGLAGPLVTELTIVPSITIGELEARNVEVRIEPESGYSNVIGVVGRIGNGLLQHYRVLLDPTAGRAVFATTDLADRPPLRSTSGIQVVVEPGRLRVVHVMRGSPAEAAGWHVGATICSIDGAAIALDYDHNGQAGWTVDTPGRIVTVGLCDGTTRKIVLQQFY